MSLAYSYLHIISGKHFCEPITVPAHSAVIYATEKGTIDDKNVTEFRTGTLAEIQCMNGTHPDGDNLITCLNDGTWDNNPPECIVEKVSAELIEVEEIVITETPIPVIVSPKRVPDRAFWKSLHSFLFFGCGDDVSKRSLLCDNYPSNLTDLNNYEVDTNHGIQNTDLKLVDLFERTLASVDFPTVDVGTLFEYILYQNETSEEDKMDKNMEDSFRLTLCFYMNILSSESPLLLETEASTSEGSSMMESDEKEDVGRKIIRLIRKIVQPAFEKLVQKEGSTTTEKSLTGLYALLASKESDGSIDEK